MKYQDIDIEIAIAKLKERVETKQMNLLVGAGASCCASNFYQNWVGLVTDMVAFLYIEELERKGIEVEQDDGFYCHYNLTRKDDPKDKNYIYDTIKTIVNREGVLEIPSKFARQMGVRESIEAYIESHTPRIDVSSKTTSRAALFQHCHHRRGRAPALRADPESSGHGRYRHLHRAGPVHAGTLRPSGLHRSA